MPQPRDDAPPDDDFVPLPDADPGQTDAEKLSKDQSSKGHEDS